MEFFNWLTLPQYVIQYAFGGMDLDQLYICIGVAAALYLLCLVFGGLGLWVMGTRRGIKHAWLGFLPFANTYFAGKLAGETTLFGVKMKRAGLYAMLAEIVYVALEILSLVISVVLSNPAYYETRALNGSYYREMAVANIPAGLQWMVAGLTWAPIVSMVAFLVLVVFLCAVYNALYRKYYARSPFLMTFLSVLLPVRGFVLFAVRRNTPVDYGEWMRARMETVMRQNGMSPSGTGGQASPFGDYADSPASRPSAPDSPFAEFDSPKGGTPSDSDGGAGDTNPKE